MQKNPELKHYMENTQANQTASHVYPTLLTEVLLKYGLRYNSHKIQEVVN